MRVLSVSALFPVFVSLQAAEVHTEGRELVDGQQLSFLLQENRRRSSQDCVWMHGSWRLDMAVPLDSRVAALSELHSAPLPAGERGPWAHLQPLGTALPSCQRCKCPLATKSTSRRKMPQITEQPLYVSRICISLRLDKYQKENFHFYLPTTSNYLLNEVFLV